MHYISDIKSNPDMGFLLMQNETVIQISEQFNTAGVSFYKLFKYLALSLFSIGTYT